MKINCILYCLGFMSVSVLNLYAQPPKAPSQSVTETIFGKQVTDPYRNLENLADSNVEKWYRQEGADAKEQLNKFPNRKKIMQNFFSFTSSMSGNNKASVIITDRYLIYVRAIIPMKDVREYHLFNRKTNQDTILFRSDDPAVMDTSQYRIMSLKMSPDENYLCLDGYKKDGSEFQCLRFFHIPSMKILPDIVFKKFEGWMPDSRSIAVLDVPITDTRSDELYENTAIDIYTIGKDDFVDIFSTKSTPQLKLNPRHITEITSNTESSYLAAYTLSSSPYFHNIYFAPLGTYNKIKRAWKPVLFPNDSVDNAGVIIYGNYIYYRSASGNANFTLRRVSVLSGKKEIIINDRERILHDFTIANNTLYYILRNGLQCQLFASSLNDLKDSEQLSLPKEGLASIGVTPGSKRVLLTIASWTAPNEEYLFDPADHSWSINPLNSLAKLPWKGKVESKEVWVKARDGVMVPLTLIYAKDFKPDGKAAALITGYGSYGHSEFPSMNPMYLLDASKGIVIAIAHVRGGGELGADWHLAGMKKNKFNSWNDFIDCAEWLVSNKYANGSKLIAEGNSAGGILVGRAVTERPDLFCGAVITVGVLNASRFAYTSNGEYHFDELGNPAIEEDFKSLYEMDAYLHIKDSVAYPAMYITAGWNDIRVIPWQPGKFAARLQNSSVQGNPVYFVMNFDAGHMSMGLDDIINRFAFLYQQWKIDPYEKALDKKETELN